MLCLGVRWSGWKGALLGSALVSIVTVTSRPALAQAPADAPAAELVALEKQLDEDLVACGSDDCTIACQALESMIRSAERICALEPGPRCAAARDKVATAKRRVRPRCPECASAAEVGEGTEETQPLPAPPADEPDLDEEQYAGEAAGPPPADQGAGCAACTLGGRGDRGGLTWLLLATGLGLLRRGRRRARRR